MRRVQLWGPFYVPEEDELVWRRHVQPWVRCARFTFVLAILIAFAAAFADLIRALKWAAVLAG
jgi:hypothetical protein